MSYNCNCAAGCLYAKDEEAVKKLLSILRTLGIDSEEYPKGSLEIDVHSSRRIRYDESDYSDIASLCAKESYLDFLGEDYNVWSLVFRDGKQYDVPGKIEWRPGPERISVPLYDGYRLEAEQNGDPDLYKEISVSLISSNGSVVQDIAMIGEEYRYEGDKVVPLHGQYSVKVWTDPDSEDWQIEHIVTRFDEYEERCRDCGYLVEGDNGEWICDNAEKDIHDVPDSECELETSHIWTDPVRTCCICGEPISDYGNDPWPVSENPDDRCCDACNAAVVIPARIRNLQAKTPRPSFRDVSCKVFSGAEFRSLLEDIYRDKGIAVYLDFSADGLYIGLGEEDIPAEDLHERLAAALDVGEVTSIHIDDCEPTGVWVAFRDKEPKRLSLDCCCMQPPADAE